jgi:hypothetical protein
VKEEDVRHIGTGYYREQDWFANFSHATWAVVVGERADRDGRVYRRIWEVHIWGKIGIEPVTKVICEWLYGRGADINFLLAIGNKEKEKVWLRQAIGPGSSPEKIKIAGKECIIRKSSFGLEFGEEHVVNRSDDSAAAKMFSRFGGEGNKFSDENEKLNLLPEAQRQYAKTL